MRTRRSLGDDLPATASAGKISAGATTAAQRRNDRRATAAGPHTLQQADPSSQSSSQLTSEQNGGTRSRGAPSETEMHGDDCLVKSNGAGAEAAARGEVTSLIKGTTSQLQKASSFVAPRSPHPPRIQPRLPPSSQASRSTSPAESHAGHIQGETQRPSASSEDVRAARSDGKLGGADSSSGSKRKGSARRFDDAASSRPRASSDRLQPSDRLHGAPHPTDVRRRPPAFELSDSSPLKRTSPDGNGGSSDLIGDGDSDVTAGGNRRGYSFHGSEIQDEDDDALMLPAQEPVGASNSSVSHWSGVAKMHYWPAAEVAAPHPPPLAAVSEESDGYPTATRRNLLPDLLNAEYGDDSERSSPRVELGRRSAGRNVPLTRRQAVEGPSGAAQRPFAVPVGLAPAKSSALPALADAEPNPFRTAMLPQLAGHRRSHSMAGHERAATYSTLGGGNESSFLEADSFAARRLHSLTRPAKARDSLAMRSRAPRSQAPASQPASVDRPPSVAAFGQAQILLSSADPCVCGFTGGKRRRLSALNGSDGRLSDDSLLGSGGKENSPASTSRGTLGGWDAHTKGCETLREMRAQGWRIYREI